MSDAPETISLLPDDGWSWMEGRSVYEPNAIEYTRTNRVQTATSLREQRLNAFLVGDLSDALAATRMAATSDQLDEDTRYTVELALRHLESALDRQKSRLQDIVN
ncbi:MAG: hypothetical protein NXH74_11345 [Rhodobacteraceae bacterium]|nr:hypothetical protein [Paracoccaceae bacterium]